MAILVKSSGHFPFSYISWQISHTSCTAFSPRFFNISAGISSTPTAFLFFISEIAAKISVLSNVGPFSSSSTSCSSSICKSSVFGFPSLSYKYSKYALHVSLTASASVIVFPALSVTPTFLHVPLFFHVNSATLAHPKSDLSFELSSSNSSHSLLHHASFAFLASLRSSLLSCLYLFFSSSLFMLFHLLLSSILLIIPCVIHDFLIFSFFSCLM